MMVYRSEYVWDADLKPQSSEKWGLPGKLARAVKGFLSSLQMKKSKDC